MAKFEIEMEIQGFKLRVKAEREDDIPRITGQISKQLAGMLQPPAEIFNGSPQIVPALTVPPVTENGQESDKGKGRAKGNRRRNSVGSEGSPSQTINWQHDAAKWGTPRQAWTAGQKILWLLYVIDKEKGQKEVGGPAIAETFNAAFKQFGPLKKPSMPRDLGNLKIRSPAQVMDNTTKSPITWYLTEEGIKEAEKLVLDAKGTSPAQ